MSARTLFAELLFVACSIQLGGAQVVIRGVVTGHDGRPMPTAVAQIWDGANEVIDSAIVGANGAFELRSRTLGLLRLELAGPLHGVKDSLIFADRPQTISVRAQLSAPEYLPQSDQLRLSTSEAGSPLNNTPFVRQQDGTFTAEIQSRAAELLVAVNGVAKGRPPVELPGAAEYRCLHNLHCYAVAHPVNGNLRVVFEPAGLVRSSQPAWVRYTNADSPVALAAEVLDRTQAFLLAMRDARREAALRTGKAVDQLPKEAPPAAKVDQVVREIERETLPIVRSARFIEYFAMVVAGAAADHALVRRALEHLTPSSPLWTFPYANMAGQAIVATGEPAKYTEYAMRAVDAQPTKALKAFVDLAVVNVLRAGGLAPLAEPFVAKARSEFGDLPVVKAVLGDRVRAGKPAPPFHAPSLENSAIEYTDASLKGRVYLIDFWATWCAPCIAEFPGLTKLYETYRDRGFEILSYSIDSNADVVRRFRKERHPMRWLHAMDPQLRQLDSPMAKDFEVIAIPRPVLVDRDGIVIATDAECRGAKLEDLLKRVLPGAAAPR